jgi:hypothetical protein
VDLLADVAVGAQNLKRVDGSEGSRPERREALKGSPSSWEVSMPGIDRQNIGRPRGRGNGGAGVANQIATTAFGAHFEERGNPQEGRGGAATPNLARRFEKP